MVNRLAFVPLFCLSFLVGCGQDAVEQPSPQAPCQDGLRRNPITGVCESTTPAMPADLGSEAEDMIVTGKKDMDKPDLVVAPVDMPSDMQQVVRDMQASGEDLGVPNKDMAPDMMVVPPPSVTRFVALGDTGEGSETQRQVGQAIGQVCMQYGGCEFGMLLGDNAYDSGVDGPNDPFFMDIFVNPYGHLNFPFYVVLGNHDLGGDGLGLDLDFEKGDYQVQYSQMNPQWLMPSKFYQVDLQHVWLLGLNTTEIFFGQDATQRGQVPDWIRDAPLGDWKIAFGHHPYISNGKHGNSGNYEGLPFVPIANGEHIKSFMESFICGKVDLYLAGHDHSLQDLEPTCGTEFIVTGAGAKTTEVKGSNPAYFNAREVGFTMLEATPAELKVYFFDAQGALLHQRVITR